VAVRNALVFLVIGSASCLWAAQPAGTAKATRIYYLGNSLTDELKYDAFVELAKARGHEIVWGRQMSPGIPINALYGMKNGGGFTRPPFGPWGKALSEYSWDVMTMQPFGTLFEPQMKAAREFCRELMNKSPDAQVYIYAQWPGKGGAQRAPMVQNDAVDWDLRFAGPQDLYEPPKWGTKDVPERLWYPRIVEALPAPLNGTFKDRSLKHQYEAMVLGLNREKATNRPVRLIPAGHVMQLLGQKMRAGLVPGYTSLWQLYQDGVHVTNVGSYLVALTFYATIFGDSPVGLPVGPYEGKPGFGADGVVISPELARVIQETVWEVVSSHPLTGVSTKRPVAVASPLVDPAVDGEPYRFELLAAFGRAPYRWSVVDGALPEGLKLSEEGTLTGTPSRRGASPVAVQVSDAAGNKAQKRFRLEVAADTAPALPAQRLPKLAVGQFCDHMLRSEGGNGPCRWSVAKGSALPPGLTLDPTGRLWGAPGKEGGYDVSPVVTDGDSGSPETAQGTLRVEVGPATGPAAFARRLDKEPRFQTGKSATFDPAQWDFRYPIKKLVQGKSGTVSGAFDLAWTDKALYIAVKVNDATVRSAPDGHFRRQFDYDAVVLCVDALNNRQATYNADDRWIVYPRGNPYTGRPHNVGSAWGLFAVQKEHDGGYYVCIQVSFASLGLRGLGPYHVLGIDLMIADGMEGGHRSTVVWQGTKDNRTDPSKFGTVILGAGPARKGAR
jgi:hypothetical protein